MGKMYRNGMLEAVVFAFYRDGKILLEKRQKSRTVITIPAGTVEDMDARGGDYSINAMMRETFEELHVKPRNFELLETYKDSNARMTFHAFLITGWDGEIPNFIEDDGERSEVIWVDLDQCQKILTFETAKIIIRKIEQMVKN